MTLAGLVLLAQLDLLKSIYRMHFLQAYQKY